jgi:hypothetical protein
MEKGAVLGRKLTSWLYLALAAAWLSACTAENPVSSARGPQVSRGFFERLSDQMTRRECNVVRFTCPYGLGPAGEPCECVDPGGVVLQGRTVR